MRRLDHLDRPLLADIEIEESAGAVEHIVGQALIDAVAIDIEKAMAVQAFTQLLQDRGAILPGSQASDSTIGSDDKTPVSAMAQPRSVVA